MSNILTHLPYSYFLLMSSLGMFHDSSSCDAVSDCLSDDSFEKKLCEL